MSTRTPERVIEVDWGKPANEARAAYPVDIAVEAVDRQGLLRDISEVFDQRAHECHGRADPKSVKGTAWMTFTVEVDDAATAWPRFWAW
jgi:GTP pyrophosphokinase